MENQKKIWNNIAPEWAKFKTKPSAYAIEFLKKQTGNVLDLGSGSGRHLQKIKSGKMFLVDFSDEMIKQAKNNIKEKNINAECKVSDISKLPYENNFFDSAICISSLHCLPKTKHKKAVKELFRVLKPKAQALIGVWNKNSRRFKNSQKEKFVGWRDKGQRYYYLFEEKEVHNLFKKTGFRIISTHNSEMMINFVVEKDNTPT